MSRFRLTKFVRSLALVAGVGMPCLAQAADLPEALPPEPMLPPPVVIGGGWYLRGDVGVGATQVHDLQAFEKDGKKSGYGYQVDSVGVSDQFFAGAGVGYQFNDFLRGDITGEYRGGSNINGHASYPSDDPKYPHIQKYDGRMSSVVALANAYFDLGTWYGLTPFIGAGVGGAFHNVHSFYDTGFSASQGGFGAAKERWTSTLAWALHAGIAYDVTPNFKVEVGYRYLDMGNAKTSDVVCVPGCESPQHYKVKDLTSHDVKIGVRYLLGGVVAPMAPLYEPGPIVRKY